MNQLELAAALDALTLQEEKIALEQATRFDALTVAIADLQAALEAAWEGASAVSPEVQASLDNLQIAVKNLDDAIPDAPVGPPVEPPVEPAVEPPVEEIPIV